MGQVERSFVSPSLRLSFSFFHLRRLYLRSPFSLLVPSLHFARRNLLTSDTIRCENVLESRLEDPLHGIPDENLKGTTRRDTRLASRGLASARRLSPVLSSYILLRLLLSFSFFFFFLSGARLSTLGFCAAPVDPSLRRGLDTTSNDAHLVRFLFSSTKYVA